ncbi:MAG: hypothetical protein CMI29_11265 [Opitutae bacterium]|nr:hypothetical protein [Opitutae bacterium]
MNKAVLVFIWVLTGLSAYWLGLRNGSSKSDSTSGLTRKVPGQKAPVQEKVRANGVSFATNRLSDRLPEPGEVDQGFVPFTETPREVAVGGDLYLRIQSSNPVIRMQAFAELLANPDQESIEAAIEAYGKLPEGPSRFSELRMLAFSWAQSDPAAAMAWTRELGRFEQRIGSGAVMDSWSRSDPQAAIAWAKENFEGEDNPYFIGIVSGMSETDMVGATELMTSMPYGRSRGRAASILLERSWTEGEDVAMSWAENLADGSLKKYAYGEIGKKIARDDLGRAVEWVDGMDESEVKTQVGEDVAERWARENPADAAEWVGRMPEGETRSESMEEVVSQWARKDPTATAEWLNQFPAGELMDEPIQRFVREVVRDDPETALTWAEAIVDEERKERAVSEVKRVAERIAKQAEAAESGEAPPEQEGQGRGPGGRGGRGGPPFGQPR